MEAKFFSEIEKKISVKAIKDFEKEVRAKINHEFETIRKKNPDLSRILMRDESYSWNKIKFGEYSWINLDPVKNKKLFRLIDLYSNFNEVIDSVKELNKKIEKVLELKESPVDSD